MNLKRSIRVALAQRDQNQQWLAEQLDCDTSTISVIMRRNRTSLTTLENIAGVFGLSVGELLALGENDAKKAENSHE